MMQTPGNDQLPEKIFSIKDISLLNDPGLFAEFAAYINHLINTDFQELLQLLYRIDVNESTLRIKLKENEMKNAGEVIAALIIERQQQKIKSRQENSREENSIDEEEKW